MDPELYKDNNDFQKRDASLCLQAFGTRINWTRKASVIDLGSGDGYVTSNLLQRTLPEDFQRIVGVDISENMVRHANEHYSTDRISFSIMDIEGKLPEHFVGSFHHAFSFYALHWIHEQEKAFDNIYQLLAPNGTCLLMFMCSSSVYDAWRVLVGTKKWAPWAKALDRIVVRYHDLEDPVKEVERIMTEVGFKNVHVERCDSPYVYKDLDELKRFVQSLNPFKLQGDILEDFGKDFVEICVRLSFVQPVEDRHPAVKISNTRLVAYGCKL